jgi:hypothetical protein
MRRAAARPKPTIAPFQRLSIVEGAEGARDQLRRQCRSRLGDTVCPASSAASLRQSRRSSRQARGTWRFANTKPATGAGFDWLAETDSAYG